MRNHQGGFTAPPATPGLRKRKYFAKKRGQKFLNNTTGPAPPKFSA
jgi:hypothetical protein